MWQVLDVALIVSEPSNHMLRIDVLNYSNVPYEVICKIIESVVLVLSKSSSRPAKVKHGATDTPSFLRLQWYTVQF